MERDLLLNHPLDPDEETHLTTSERGDLMSENVIRIMCPNLRCKAVLAVPIEARGRMVRCRACSVNIKVPMKRETEPMVDSESGEAPSKNEKS